MIINWMAEVGNVWNEKATAYAHCLKIAYTELVIQNLEDKVQKVNNAIFRLTIKLHLITVKQKEISE